MKHIAKIFSLGILFLFVISNLNAQSCNSKKDPITGESVTKTDFFKITGKQMPRIDIAFNKVASVSFIELTIYTNGLSIEMINPTDEFIIKLVNGKLIKKSTEEKVVPQAVTYVDATKYEVKLYVSDDDLNDMVNSVPNFVRFSVSNKTHDVNISGKDAAKMVKAIKCILQ